MDPDGIPSWVLFALNLKPAQGQATVLAGGVGQRAVGIAGAEAGSGAAAALAELLVADAAAVDAVADGSSGRHGRVS